MFGHLKCSLRILSDLSGKTAKTHVAIKGGAEECRNSQKILLPLKPHFSLSFTCLSWFTLQGRRTLAAGTPTCKAEMKQNTPINREITDRPPAPVAKSSPSKGLPLLHVVCSPKWSWPCYQTALTLHTHVVIPLEIH